MSASHGAPFNPPPKITRNVLQSAAFLAPAPSGWPFPRVGGSGSNSAGTWRTPRLGWPGFASLLRLVSPLALPPLPAAGLVRLYPAGLIQSEGPQRPRVAAPPLIRRRRLHRHQLSVITQLIHRRTEGWKAIRDGRFLCATKNELPGDRGWGG